MRFVDHGGKRCVAGGSSCHWICCVLAIFDDVLGPVVECGNGLVSPAVHSQCFARAREQYLSVFGWGSLPFGALASGAIVVWAEPELGRGLALKMPFVVAAIGSGAILVYGILVD